MKKTILNLVVCITLGTHCNSTLANTNKHTLEGEKQTASTQTPAPGEWVKVSVEEANLNPFTLFQHAAALNVGKPGAMNSMTIGWGQLGVIWGGARYVCTVYVRQSRFTKHLMDENETFTVEAFPQDKAGILFSYLGRVSGRDEDKMKGCGFTLKTMENGAPAFEEGNLILECKRISEVDITHKEMSQEVINSSYRADQPEDYHTQYIGEITAVWVKK